jgi:hypothetical protein
MALQDKLGDSKLSLKGAGITEPTLLTPSWGYKDPKFVVATTNPLNPLDPSLSSLHNTYDVNSVPADVTIVNFNKTAYKSTVPKESILDELDASSLAPKNLQVGTTNSVVSQLYKSSTGQKYSNKGPKDGRYI